MAKNINTDLDDNNFSFGAASAKKKTTISKPVVKQTEPVNDDTEDVVDVDIMNAQPSNPTPTTLDKSKKQPLPIPEGSSDALDTRYVINSTDDITGHTMWNTMVNGIYSSVYLGMQVYVKQTKDIMVYVGPTSSYGVLVADASNLNYWVTLKNTQNMDKMITSVTINNRYVSVMDATGTKLNIDMAGTKVPYKDGYISLVDLDWIRKMMGDQSIEINDTYPDLTNIVNNIYDRLTLEGNDL